MATVLRFREFIRPDEDGIILGVDFREQLQGLERPEQVLAMVYDHAYHNYFLDPCVWLTVEAVLYLGYDDSGITIFHMMTIDPGEQTVSLFGIEGRSISGILRSLGSQRVGRAIEMFQQSRQELDAFGDDFLGRLYAEIHYLYRSGEFALPYFMQKISEHGFGAQPPAYKIPTDAGEYMPSLNIVTRDLAEPPKPPVARATASVAGAKPKTLAEALTTATTRKEKIVFRGQVMEISKIKEQDIVRCFVPGYLLANYVRATKDTVILHFFYPEEKVGAVLREWQKAVHRIVLFDSSIRSMEPIGRLIHDYNTGHVRELPVPFVLVKVYQAFQPPPQLLTTLGFHCTANHIWGLIRDMPMSPAMLSSLERLSRGLFQAILGTAGLYSHHDDAAMTAFYNPTTPMTVRLGDREWAWKGGLEPDGLLKIYKQYFFGDKDITDEQIVRVVTTGAVPEPRPTQQQQIHRIGHNFLLMLRSDFSCFVWHEPPQRQRGQSATAAAMMDVQQRP